MTPEAKLKQFAKLVKSMREAQKMYFASRNVHYLQESKILEKKVDALISEIDDSNQPKQTSIF